MAQIEVTPGLVVTLLQDSTRVVLMPPWTEATANGSEFGLDGAFGGMPGTIPFDKIDWSRERIRITREEFVTAWVDWEMKDDPLEVKVKPDYQSYIDRAKGRAEKLYDAQGTVYEQH